jgi:intraflagellar transport protein 122
VVCILWVCTCQDAYEKVGRLDLSTKILKNLTHNAVAESRFSDAAYCYWRLAMENVKMGFQNVEKGVTSHNEGVDTFWALSTKADVYHAYSMVHKVRATV